MTWTIYKHTHKENGKSYIGITRQEPETRWKKGGGYRAQPKFYNAIKKYGWDAFSHDILEQGIEEVQEALEKEAQYILEYHCIKNGYNIMADSSKGEWMQRPIESATPNIRTLKTIVNLMAEYDVAEFTSNNGGITIKMHPQTIAKHVPATTKPLSAKDILDAHEAKESATRSMGEIIENDPRFSEWQLTGNFRGN